MKIKFLISSVFSALLLAGCAEETEQLKSVDLRYLAEDEYSLNALSPEPIRIQVKSSDPWTVTAQNPDWSVITPSSGEAGELYDVEIRYHDNVELDDRIDTLIIKSDYWIGKWVHVLQKGTAFMTLDGAEDIFLNKDGDSYKIVLASNQKWSAAVSEGSDWLSIAAGTEGEGNGEIEVSVVKNTDERRYGELTVYDRHGKAAYEVAVTQDGIQIDPVLYDIKTDSSGKVYELDVVSNSKWHVELPTESADWYSFSTTAFEGSQTLKINLTENKSPDVRKLKFTLVSDDNDKIRKEISLKQAYEVPTERKPYYVNDPDPDKDDWVKDGNPNRKGTFTLDAAGKASFSGDARIMGGAVARGTYTFHVASMSADAYAILYFISKENSTYEIRWHLDASNVTTSVSLRPTPVSDWQANNIGFSVTEQHEVSLSISKSESDFAIFDWILDGKTFCSYTADGNTGGPKIPFGSGMSIHLGATKGSVSYDWWEYTPAVDWDE